MTKNENQCQINTLEEQKKVFNEQIDEKIRKLREVTPNYHINHASFVVKDGVVKAIYKGGYTTQEPHKSEMIHCYFSDNGHLYIDAKNENGDTQEIKIQLVAPTYYSL